MFTATDITDDDPPPTERPYAGGAFLDSTIYAMGESALHAYSLRIGFVGPISFAEQVQRGDVLLLEKVERSQGVEVPSQGLRMGQVEERFGPPISRTDAVGDPPITRWRYADFTVYFEYQTVLHAVVHRDALGLGENRDRPS